MAGVHPTPAVGGIAHGRPRSGTCSRSRGSTAGCTPARSAGWTPRGDGAWAIGIRCADVEGDRAQIYAGNGIVAGSDPAEELAETQLKLQALLAALVRP